MSKPKVTLAEVLAQQRARPMSLELELAVADFLELPDAEQKVLLFRALCETQATINWLVAKAGGLPRAAE